MLLSGLLVLLRVGAGEPSRHPSRKLHLRHDGRTARAQGGRAPLLLRRQAVPALQTGKSISSLFCCCCALLTSGGSQIWDRDINAARNIQLLGKCLVLGQPRPPALSRPPRQNARNQAVQQLEELAQNIEVEEQELLRLEEEEDELAQLEDEEVHQRRQQQPPPVEERRPGLWPRQQQQQQQPPVEERRPGRRPRQQQQQQQPPLEEHPPGLRPRQQQQQQPPLEERRPGPRPRQQQQRDRPTYSWALVPLLAAVYRIHHPNIPLARTIVNAGLTDDEYDALPQLVRDLFGPDLQANYGPDNGRWTHVINTMRADVQDLRPGLVWVMRNNQHYTQDTEQQRAMVYFEQRGVPIAFLQALFEQYFNRHPNVAVYYS